MARTTFGAFYSVVFVLLSMSSTQCQGQDYKVYFGLLHGHTSFSDGSGTPSAAYDFAKNTVKLDFFAVTEHNHDQAGGSDGIFLTLQLYSQLIAAADVANEDGTFVAIYGQEGTVKLTV